jgi:hypothetical protein
MDVHSERRRTKIPNLGCTTSEWNHILADASRQAETQPQNETVLLLENQVTTTPLTSMDEARNMTIIHQASLQYAKHLQANVEQVEFNANFTLTSNGEACFKFVIDKRYHQCSFPYIRVRLLRDLPWCTYRYKDASTTVADLTDVLSSPFLEHTT